MWHCRLCDGTTITEVGSRRWGDIPPDQVMELWFSDLPGFVLRRKELPDFVEFFQYRTVRVGPDGNGTLESQTIGWTDGRTEYGIRRSCEATVRERFTLVQGPCRHFHPAKLRGSVLAAKDHLTNE